MGTAIGEGVLHEGTHAGLPDQPAIVQSDTVRLALQVHKDKRLSIGGELGLEIPGCNVRCKIPELAAVSRVEAVDQLGPTIANFVRVRANHDDTVMHSDIACVPRQVLPYPGSPCLLTSGHLQSEYPALPCGPKDVTTLNGGGGRDLAHVFDIMEPKRLAIGAELPDACLCCEVDVPALVKDRPAHDNRAIPAQRMVPLPQERIGQIPRPSQGRQAVTSHLAPGMRPVVRLAFRWPRGRQG
mmetsp:Transcript_117150/g.311571  ORF Transcript_117150/g.311571 Transcript_117150/m.311571 type:complete len:241 (+) Transcript_117150:856-1578(+)